MASQIALKHYARIKDEDYDIMTAEVVSKQPVDSNKRQKQVKPIVQKCVQSASANGCNNSQRQSEVPIKTAPCELTQEAASAKMTPTGLQTVSITCCEQSSLCHSQKSHCAESCALLENTVLSSDDRQALKTIINLWPYLSPESKIEVMRTIEAANRSQLVTGSAMK